MAKVLYIKASIKPAEASRTSRLSDAFIATYCEHHPDDEITTLDLYEEGIDFLRPGGADLHHPRPGEGREHPVLKYAYQFLEADKYVISEPLWNLGIPAILKAYIDYICVANVTFRYTAQGPVGLCLGKQAINITSRGGKYSEGPFADLEMGDRYLRTIFGFLGITDFQTLSAEMLDIVGQDAEVILGEGILKGQELARSF